MEHGPLIIAGGGLAGGLAALALQTRRPEQDFILIEAGPTFGGNHTWSCFDSDVPEAAHDLFALLGGTRWPAHQVRFAGRTRTVPVGYRSVSGEGLHRAIMAAVPPERRRLDTPIAELDAHGVRLAGGERLDGAAVIDCRGPAAAMPGIELAWQGFVGLEVTGGTDAPAIPMVMDADVPQIDGYRFVYVLPFAPDRCLVEDTYYTLDAALDLDAVAARAGEEAARRGLGSTVVRTERGMLPIVLAGEPERFWPAGDPVPRLGLAGGFFHPTTGYSLGKALALAGELAGLRGPLSSERLRHWSRNAFLAHWRKTAFFRALNRMLFWAAPPAERHRVFQHFYRLDDGLVSRFYAGQLRPLDKARILSGKPPVAVGAAMRALAGQRPAWTI